PRAGVGRPPGRPTPHGKQPVSTTPRRVLMSRAYVFNQYGGPEGEELIERPVPEPGAGEIVVEVRAAGVNPADVKLREGEFGRDERLPRALGFEVSGTVVAVGAGVEAYAVGDDVIGFVAEGEGGFADHAVLRV